MSSTTLDEELQTAGVTALVKELGPLQALRFLQLMNVRSGNYTAERDSLLGDPSFEDLMREVVARQDRSTGE